MATLLLFNGAAGDRSRGKPFWLSHLRAAGVEPDGSFEFGDDTWRSKASRDDRLLVAGGDGSVSAGAAHCVAAGCILGVLPSGTANDFSRSLGIPTEPEEACAVVAKNHVRCVDVGQINERQFLNVAHVGLGAKVGRSVSSNHKGRWGHLSYLRVLLDRIAAHRGFHATIRCDGQIVRGRWLEIAVANAPSFGGGHRVPGAALDDGRLDVVGIRPSSFLRLLRAWLAVRFGQRMPDDEALLALHGERIDIRTWRAQSVTADGEAYGLTPVQLKVHVDALRVLAPSS